MCLTKKFRDEGGKENKTKGSMRVERREVLTSAPEKVKEDVKTQKGRTERPPF